MKVALTMMMLFLAVAVSREVEDKWSCAGSYVSGMQSCVAKYDEDACIKYGKKFIECFGSETKDYNVGIRVGHGARIFIDTSERKTGHHVILDYPIDPVAASSSAYTLLKGDVTGFVIVITGKRQTVKTCNVNSWMQMLYHKTGNKPLYSRSDEVQIDAEFSSNNPNEYIANISDNERSYAKDGPVVIPGEFANAEALDGRLPYKVVLANEKKDESGNHFLEMVALLSPKGGGWRCRMTLIMGNIQHCSRCSDQLKGQLLAVLC